ncbi:MAG: o-succinylbenzoate synthase [Myxococcales bacterium]|nr:o-succinylbenzoate synthase [Myxococcales bacterium]
MRIACARIHSVALRLRAPLVTARTTIEARVGFVVGLHSDAGAVGWGEALPLPGFGSEDLPACRAALERWCRASVGAEVETLASSPIGGTARTPAARCAVELALLDLEGQRRGLRIADLLCVDTEPGESVAVNALLSGDDAPGVAASATRARRAGFRAVKLKVGAKSRERDVERVAAARSALGPSARIRLDANGAWSGDEALAILTDVERYGIEYVEQPVPADDLESLASLRRRAKVRIAADEAVADESSAIALLDAEAADVLILKPPTLGGVRATAAIAKRAADAGVDCVVTSSIDSSLGIAGALQAAVALPEPAAGPRLPCGLATGSLLEADIARGLSVRHGALTLPPDAGLGVHPDDDLLDAATREPVLCIPT